MAQHLASAASDLRISRGGVDHGACDDCIRPDLAQAAKKLLGRGEQLHGLAVLANSRNGAGEADNGIVGQRHGCVAARSVHPHLDNVWDLFRCLDSGVERPPIHHANAPPFIERKLGPYQIRMVRDEPRESGVAGHFLVGRCREDDIASQRATHVDDITLDAEHGHQQHGQHSLVIDCPPAIEIAVLRRAAERILRPRLAFRAYDIHVGRDEHRRRRSVAAQPRHQRAAIGQRLEAVCLDAGGGQRVVEVPRQRQLIAGRVRRIELDEPLEVVGGVGAERARGTVRGHRPLRQVRGTVVGAPAERAAMP